MRVVVLGAGVVGVATAYELFKDGYDVTVIDRGNEPANDASHANAGLICPGHAYAWASPEAPGIMLRSLVSEGQPIRFKPKLDPNQWRWVSGFLRNCTTEKAKTNTIHKVTVCAYSQERLHQVTSETGIEYDNNRRGILYLYRSPKSLQRSVKKSEIMRDKGIHVRGLNSDEIGDIDPALEPVQRSIAGALYMETDESGDARLFTQGLAQWLSAKGVTFLYNTTIDDLVTEGSHATAVKTSAGDVEADRFVVCLGVGSPALQKVLGIDLPIYPVKGYSVTFPIAGRNNPPTMAGVDENNLVAFGRYGDRLRVTSAAEIGGYDRSHRPTDFRHMIAAIQSLFPDGADYSQPTYWAGLRPMTPNGLPIFGRGRLNNVWLNCGHGSMGWTMACGSARVTADLIAQKTPEIDVGPMLKTAA